MKPAQQRLAADLDAAEFRDPQIPLVNNWQAREVRTAGEAREGLFQQVPNPVRWTGTILYLAERVDRFIEVGPGAILTGLIKNIAPSVPALRFGEPADLDKLA
jgi:[acyl-carrier-protein] S-malonyltransferase